MPSFPYASKFCNQYVGAIELEQERCFAPRRTFSLRIYLIILIHCYPVCEVLMADATSVDNVAIVGVGVDSCFLLIDHDMLGCIRDIVLLIG
jgi:hypothetical protein